MNEVLSSRNAVARREESELPSLQDQLTYARAISEATAMLPEAYRKQPGAILLAQEWARTRGMDLLTTIQTVAFVHGKPVVDATLQRALAKRSGYDVRPVGAITDESCTVRITGNGVDETVTFTMDDARKAKLVKADGAYEKNPKNMMVARATANAMRWYAPEVMVGLHLEDELPDELDELLPEATATVDPEAMEALEAKVADIKEQREEIEGQTSIDEALAEPVEAEVVTDPLASPETRGAARAAVDSAKAHKVYPALVEYLNEQDIPLQATKWSQSQAARIVAQSAALVQNAKRDV